MCHDFIYGPPHELRDYLIRHGIRDVLFIGHQNRYVKPNMVQSSYYEQYHDGKLLKKYESSPVLLPEPIAYIKDFLFTLYWSLTKIKGNIDYFIGAGNLNAFAGVLLLATGRVIYSYYYSIDYVPERLSNTILNALYHKIDYICALHATSTWNYGKGMIEKRIAKWNKQFPNQIIVPNGVRFRLGTIVPFEKIHRHELVYMGTLFTHQGIHMVIRALKKIRKSIPDVTLGVVGGGEYKKELQSLVENLHLKDAVTFFDFVPDPVMVDSIIAKAALGMATYDPQHPFVTNSEPGKVKRYLACGTPVLMTNISPLAQTLDGKHCGLTTEYSIDAIAEIVIKFIRDEKQMKVYRKNAVRFAKQYDWDIIFTKAFKESQ